MSAFQGYQQAAQSYLGEKKLYDQRLEEGVMRVLDGQTIEGANGNYGIEAKTFGAITKERAMELYKNSDKYEKQVFDIASNLGLYDPGQTSIRDGVEKASNMSGLLRHNITRDVNVGNISAEEYANKIKQLDNLDKALKDYKEAESVTMFVNKRLDYDFERNKEFSYSVPATNA